LPMGIKHEPGLQHPAPLGGQDVGARAHV